MTRYLLAAILFISTAFPAFSQEITLDENNQTLNTVLAGLVKSTGVEISFDDALLSQYTVTARGTFKSPADAVSALIRGLPLSFELYDGVIIIFPVRAVEQPEPSLLSGRVMDRRSGEPLPFAHVIVNGQGLIADLTGGFTCRAPSGSLLQLRVSHLGYFVLDTVLSPAQGTHIYLAPAMIGLTEVEIVNSTVSRSGQIGERAGKMKLNQQVAGFLPGFGDNSVFNLLRLMPGILAAGEQTNDLVIWGSYEGHSKVMFDGFTVYSLKNFNDNISSFNPLMAKDIEVMKAGYDARFGDRVGGIVNINGKNGNLSGTSFTMNLNNMTLNSLVEVPVTRTSALVFAFRHTYYELYNPADINARLWRNNDRDSANDVDLNIVPDYRFGDLNLKYSATFRNSDLFYVSLYGGNDRFSYAISEELPKNEIFKNTAEKNRQGGGAVFYNRNWHNGSATNFNLNYSSLVSDYSDNLVVEGKNQSNRHEVRDLLSTNRLRESTLQADHRFAPIARHRMESGLALKSNVVEFREDTFDIARANYRDTSRRATVYFQDNISLGKSLEVKAGMRLNRVFNLQRFFAEPRLSLAYQPSARWRLNAAWGKYDQYIKLASVTDDLGNYRYLWVVCDEQDIPVLTSYHYVVGLSYEPGVFTISLEGYFKETSGLTRYVRNTQFHSEGVYEGIGRSYGMDVMVKADYRGHTAWVSYTLSRTEEIFEYFLENEYRRAPQDQRHELKTALMMNFDPFFFSADYVFGSGFPPLAYLQPGQREEKIYSRLDVAFIYKFLDRRLKGEAGLSVLNVMNTRNIKYSNFERVPSNQENTINLYAESIPLTPALYLKISL